MKVAINKCFGGFRLSDEAVRAFLTLKGIEFEFDEECDNKFNLHPFYHKGHLGDRKHYIDSEAWCKNRTDKDLIKVIEELGEQANGLYAELKIVEIPDDVQYEIHEYDGNEIIREVHRTWD